VNSLILDLVPNGLDAPADLTEEFVTIHWGQVSDRKNLRKACQQSGNQVNIVPPQSLSYPQKPFPQSVRDKHWQKERRALGADELGFPSVSRRSVQRLATTCGPHLTNFLPPTHRTCPQFLGFGFSALIQVQRQANPLISDLSPFFAGPCNL
jgi:hypothetical protein